MAERDEIVQGGEPVDTTDEAYRDLAREGMDPREGSGRTDSKRPAGEDHEEPPRDKS
jgi:hypothetical protein